LIIPTAILATCSATAQGGRAGGKVALDNIGVFVHTEHAKGLGGSGEGSNPEQLFAMGYASCFNSALLFVASQQKIDAAKSTVTCEVGIGRSEAGGFALAAKLSVHVPGVDRATAQTLVEAAHQVCPYSNATRGNMPVELVVV
jgi:lipoyl-dependent peroxiredoxin